MRILFLFLCVYVNSFALNAFAQDATTKSIRQGERLTEDRILELFSGQKHLGIYNGGNSFVETHYPDTRVYYEEEGDEPDYGVWTMRDQMLCFVYRSDRYSGGCFRVYKVSNCFYFFYENMPYRKDELQTENWNSKGFMEGTDNDCDPGIS